MKIAVVIPAHNEEAAIGPLVEAVRALGHDCIVIDDGSQDGSGDMAREQGAVVIRNEEKKGKGKSLQRGFEYVMKQDFDCVLVMDGDGQHDVEDVDQFIQKAREHSPCVVTGSRMQNHKGMPLLRLCTNRFMSLLISAVCRQNIPDTQCGFRLISLDVLKELRLTSSDFEIETEVLIKASKKGFKIFSVPIKTIYRNELSKINPLKDTIRFFKYLIKEILSLKT